MIRSAAPGIRGSTDTHTLTFRLGERIWFHSLCGVCTGSAQDLLDECGAEPSQGGPVQSRAVVCVSQTEDLDQVFSRETALGEVKTIKPWLVAVIFVTY